MSSLVGRSWGDQRPHKKQFKLSEMYRTGLRFLNGQNMRDTSMMYTLCMSCVSLILFLFRANVVCCCNGVSVSIFPFLWDELELFCFFRFDWFSPPFGYPCDESDVCPHLLPAEYLRRVVSFINFSFVMFSESCIWNRWYRQKPFPQR